MLRFVVASMAFALLLSAPTVDASRKKRDTTIEFTIFERQSDDGPRHSPLFTLPVRGEELEFPSKMVLFNNDLYGSEDGLIDEDEDELIGYNQGHCVETVATEGFIAECFFTYVFEDVGSLTANGPFRFDATDGVQPSVLAVTGGTGDYASFQGEAAVSAGPADPEDFPSLKFDFTLKKTSRN